ncbi:tRNA pseudouridine(38-40) synthase TruA [Endozoicomonas sp. OPT23]|uniref:tRNA pseudouridine(38-40) synthase TruA n=1 Tax=Endozoicomonas sp. OPT23 TaxID=2072845 RepID=UPI00129B5DF1|nr:tRNA pseudouridine(38-40) synthase TruA [Endozoicomonas sp. OPT23]MRI35012.1 tRNA pseudouridine(38-40) synthase TruA [Endozoicomonas sp. OPT23]
MPRFVASVQYDGSRYHGWQSLKTGHPSVQETVEKALSKVANHSVSVVCAGRTDAGVHGCNQIIHFDSDAERSSYGWTFGTNSGLPDDIALNWVQPVSDDFHARFSAEWRRYRYVILNRRIRPAHLPKGVTYYHRPLDVELMNIGGQYLIGEHDFDSYRAVQCQAKHAVREMQKLEVHRHGDMVIIDIRANAFLHHMVRNITGVLQEVGSGRKPPIWVKEVLDARDRSKAGVTAKPHGLYFVDVGYPEQFDLPKSEPNPFFVAAALPW